MNNKKPSDTFQELYYSIIDVLFKEILDANINLCLKSPVVQYEICSKFENYKKQALNFMEGKRLDRHKLAACICGAVADAKPLLGVGHVKISETVNERLALYVGLHTIKQYMQYDFLEKIEPYTQYERFLTYIQSYFVMEFPSEHICDKPNYINNLSNALYWRHMECKSLKKECFLNYDILAYSTIFYHLDLYNRPQMEQCYYNFVEQEKNAFNNQQF